VFRILPEYQTRLIELEKGGIDLMTDITVADADKLRKSNPEINLVRRGWRSNDYVAWNLKNPLFEDKAVRKALAHAVDVDSMIAKLHTSETGEAYAKRMTGTITPALCGVYNDAIVPIPHNIEEAKGMLAAAGWTDTDSDGVIDKDGKKFEFTLSTNNGNKVRADAQVLIQAQLKQVGIKVNLEKLDTNAFYENLRKRDYDSALAGWAAGLFVDPTNLWHCDTEEKRYEFNFTSYCNPEVDALIAKGMSTPDPKESAVVWKEFQEKLHEDQPYMFLWWQDEIVGIHDRFENTTIDVLGAFGNLHQWEVPADKVKYKR
jgi:peptide/nickel transport system substrate-binding protein